MRLFRSKKRFISTATFAGATGHGLYGKVVISATPATTFSFRSDAVWHATNHEGAVRTGIMEVLAGKAMGRALTAEYVLHEVGGNHSDSHWDAYYQASKLATADLLRKIDEKP